MRSKALISFSLSGLFFKPNSRRMSTRSYRDAIEHLNSLQSNAAALDAVRSSGGRLNEFAIPEMHEYLERIGYSPKDLDVLNVIHVTGTKGKGSTSAFTDSILRHCLPGAKIGLYTSPHLVAVRERIRINAVPISEEEFAVYFFEIWDRLVANNVTRLSSTSLMPGYFRFLTLLAFHVFLSLRVDATVLEVGVGGTYDSTNIVSRPIVTGVTALGIDHVFVLGKTLPEIAWHKGGIFKEGVPALTVDQPLDGLRVLEERARELRASEFIVIPPDSSASTIQLGLAGKHQVQNASLSVALARWFFKSRVPDTDEKDLSSAFVTALKETRWPGRCQTLVDTKRANITWYLDGAHTLESLECCMQWFVSPGVGIDEKDSRPDRVLVFNCTSGRSGSSFLSSIHTTLSIQLKLHGSKEDALSFFDHVIFCTNVTYADGKFKGDLTAVAIPEDDLSQLKTQHELAAAWTKLFPEFPTSNVHVLPSIQHTVMQIENIRTSKPMKVLVTGSLHLVGGVIEVRYNDDCLSSGRVIDTIMRKPQAFNV